MDYFWQLYDIWYFRTKNMDPYPRTVILFLLVDSCQKNEIRTNEPNIH